MIPDLDKRLNETMNKASLKELMPDFDAEQEWEQLSAKLKPATRKFLLPKWSYAAAAALLLAAGLGWYLIATTAHQQQLAQSNHAPAPVQPANATTFKDSQVQPAPKQNNTTNAHAEMAVIRKPVVKHKAGSTDKQANDNDIIYNSTPCPIEVRISQMMKCPNNQPRAISSSSTVEPDQSAQINYKETNTIARNCSLILKEIEIKSIATGEIILLNSSSTPSTAQEVFSYITREKKGDVLAGVFNYDCDKRNRKHSVRLNNRDGALILE